jgi:hypothetical protein
MLIPEAWAPTSQLYWRTGSHLPTGYPLRQTINYFGPTQAVFPGWDHNGDCDGGPNSQGSDSCTFSVTVNDIEKADWHCSLPGQSTRATTTGQCSAVDATRAWRTPFDNCPGATELEEFAVIPWSLNTRLSGRRLNHHYLDGDRCPWQRFGDTGNSDHNFNDTETPTVSAPLSLGCRK